MQNDGYSLDDKRNKIDNSDLPDIVTEYQNRHHKTQENNRCEKCFFVSKKEVIENDYDLSLGQIQGGDLSGDGV